MKKLPNIILIICDTLGAKHMSLYGYKRKTTPNLERLVEKEGFAVYTRCFAPAPWTTPSHASLFTGLYPSEHGIDGNNYALNKKLLCLDEVFNRMGYRVYMISNNHFISKDLKYGRFATQFFEMWNLIYSKDFSFFFKKFSTLKMFQKFFFLIDNPFSLTDKVLFTLELFYQILIKKYPKLRKRISSYSSPHTQRSFKLLSNLLREKHKNIFIFLNIIENHSKFNPPTRFRNIFVQDNSIYEKYNTISYGLEYYVKQHLGGKEISYIEAQYDQEVLYVDYILSEFYYRNKDILENSVFIITSDHGESFLEDRDKNYIEHSFGLRNTNLHIPLLIKWPKEYGIRGEIDCLVQLQDLYSTVLDLVGFPYPSPWSSRSLLSCEKRKFVISQLLDVNYKILALKNRKPDFKPLSFMQPMMSVITEDLWKITKWLDGTIEVYDLNKDLYETRNLAQNESYIEKTAKLKKLIDLLAKATNFNKVAVTPIS